MSHHRYLTDVARQMGVPSESLAGITAERVPMPDPSTQEDSDDLDRRTYEDVGAAACRFRDRLPLIAPSEIEQRFWQRPPALPDAVTRPVYIGQIADIIGKIALIKHDDR